MLPVLESESNIEVEVAMLQKSPVQLSGEPQ
jgi:hypothetical protein